MGGSPIFLHTSPPIDHEPTAKLLYVICFDQIFTLTPPRRLPHHTQDLHKTPRRRRRHWHSDQLQSPPSSPPFVQPIKLINNVESYLITSNTMAPPIATPTPQRRGDGVTIMEGKLMTLFFDHLLRRRQQ
jgi:hypothetical protein